MRTVDVILAFPQLVFALLLLSLLGPKLWLIVLAVGLSHAPQVARVLRSATLDISERDYVKAAELQGMRPARVMVKEILPNLVSPLMVETGLRLTYSIVIMAGLAFLGFGQPPPAPNWGYMINENRIGLPLNPWAVIVPAALIALLTIGTNTFTDAVARVAIGVDAGPRRPRCSTTSARGVPHERHPRQLSHAGRASGRRAGLRLEVRDLEVRLGASGPDVVSEVSFSVRAGEVLGLVGESGSGKTTVALALLGHARRGLSISVRRGPPGRGGPARAEPGRAAGGARGQGHLRAPGPGGRAQPHAPRRDPAREALRVHAGVVDDPEARIAEVMREASLDATPEMLSRYPHQLSGGQQQRVTPGHGLLVPAIADRAGRADDRPRRVDPAPRARHRPQPVPLVRGGRCLREPRPRRRRRAGVQRGGHVRRAGSSRSARQRRCSASRCTLHPRADRGRALARARRGADRHRRPAAPARAARRRLLVRSALRLRRR